MVAVFHREDQDIDELLAPYSEELKVEPYIRFTRDEAIDYVRKNYTDYYSKSDDECWSAMASDYDYNVDDEGNIYSTYNPKSKWDWYTIGGRFSGHCMPVDEDYVKDIDFSPNKDEYEYAIKWWQDNVEGDGRDLFYTRDYYTDRYGTKEKYAEQYASFSTYAVVTPDGEWHAPGEMGWFGCSSETDEEFRDWYDHYKERFIDTADPDWILTIVDCHI